MIFVTFRPFFAKDLEETIGERLYGLTEMFPQSLRNSVCTVSSKSVELVKNSYSMSRTFAWIFFSTTSIMLVPLLLETERQSMKRALDKQVGFKQR
jgi:import receptor subunit TOM22